jgi:hypothetical protein
VQGNPIVAADAGERVVRRTTRAHIVFGMNLEETLLFPLGQDRLHMFMLEAGPCEARNRMRRKA